MKKKKVIFLDLDGTILEISERNYSVYRTILKKYGKKFLAKKKYLEMKRKKIPVEEILEKTKAQDILADFKREWKEKIEDTRFLNLDKLSYSTKKTLLFLKKDYKLVLVTLRNHPKRLMVQLRRKKLDKVFDKILVKPGKDYRPRWKIKYNLIRKHERYDKDSLIIGDTETDVLAGKQLGIKTVTVLDGMRDGNILKNFKPNYLIKNITHLNLCNF